MEYNKLTVANFKERLKADNYKNATGARRAIGKMSTWSDAEKASAHKLVNKHFGDDAPAPVAKKTSKKRKKTAKTSNKKTAEKVPVKRGKKKVSAKKAGPKKKKVSKKKVSKKSGKKRATKAASSKESPAGSEYARIHIVGELVGTVSHAMKAMDLAKNSGVDVVGGMQRAQNVLTKAIAGLEADIDADANGSNGGYDPVTAQRFLESAGAAVAPSSQPAAPAALTTPPALQQEQPSFQEPVLQEPAPELQDPPPQAPAEA